MLVLACLSATVVVGVESVSMGSRPSLGDGGTTLDDLTD